MSQAEITTGTSPERFDTHDPNDGFTSNMGRWYEIARTNHFRKE